MPPEITLAFDTSAAHCAAALLLPGNRVLQRHETMSKGQAERLMPLVEELLAEASIGWSDLTAIAVGTGPGNFTGVRIAVSAARGLALALQIPAVGVTTLEALAFGQPRPIRVMEDARRGMVYVQEFRASGLPSPARLASAEALPPFDGPETGSSAGPGALPSAVSFIVAIARIGAERARSPQPRPAPFYLRPADAAPPADPPPVILDA